MSQALLTEEIKKKWAPLIEDENVTEIKDITIRNCVTRLLENTEKDLKEASGTVSGAVAIQDPVLISMVRRTMPSLIAYDVVGVQPMSGPSGLIFAMKSWYGGTSSGTEAFDANEPNKDFAAKQATAAGEVLGTDDEVDTTTSDANQPVVQANPWPEMSFSIEKATVTAQTRALKAKYTEELAQDLRAIHGLDAETELANILSGELVAEMNREMVAEINGQARPGAQAATVAGTFNIAADADGRWSFEKYKTILQQIHTEANIIAKTTRRGRGNFIIASADVVSALEVAGKFDQNSFGGGVVNQDAGIGVTFAGVLAGQYKVYIDPYAASDYITVGYKGANVYDAGIFWAPYVPLNMVRAIGEEDFQPRIGFKTRYGLAYNPFVTGTVAQNDYYRTFAVTNLV